MGLSFARPMLQNFWAGLGTKYPAPSVWWNWTKTDYGVRVGFAREYHQLLERSVPPVVSGFGFPIRVNNLKLSSSQRLVDVVGRAPFAYYPLGGGPRVCIGGRLAEMQSLLVLSAVLQRYSLHAVPGQRVEPAAMLSLRPKGALWMTMHERVGELLHRSRAVRRGGRFPAKHQPGPTATVAPRPAQSPLPPRSRGRGPFRIRADRRTAGEWRYAR